MYMYIYTQPIALRTVCTYNVIILTHWIYLYIIHTKAEKIVLTFKTFIPLANINFCEYCQCVPEKLRPVFCPSFHSIDATFQ